MAFVHHIAVAVDWEPNEEEGEYVLEGESPVVVVGMEVEMLEVLEVLEVEVVEWREGEVGSNYRMVLAGTVAVVAEGIVVVVEIAVEVGMKEVAVEAEVVVVGMEEVAGIDFVEVVVAVAVVEIVVEVGMKEVAGEMVAVEEFEVDIVVVVAGKIVEEVVESYVGHTCLEGEEHNQVFVGVFFHGLKE